MTARAITPPPRPVAATALTAEAPGRNPSQVTGRQLLAPAMSLRARGLSGLDVLRRSRDRAPPFSCHPDRMPRAHRASRLHGSVPAHSRRTPMSAVLTTATTSPRHPRWRGSSSGSCSSPSARTAASVGSSPSPRPSRRTPIRWR